MCQLNNSVRYTKNIYNNSVHYPQTSLWAHVQKRIKEHQLTKIISKEKMQLLYGVDQLQHPAPEMASPQPWRHPHIAFMKFTIYEP